MAGNAFIVDRNDHSGTVRADHLVKEPSLRSRTKRVDQPLAFESAFVTRLRAIIGHGVIHHVRLFLIEPVDVVVAKVRQPAGLGEQTQPGIQELPLPD